MLHENMLKVKYFQVLMDMFNQEIAYIEEEGMLIFQSLLIKYFPMYRFIKTDY